jgi:hypothetical protein
MPGGIAILGLGRKPAAKIKNHFPTARKDFAR